MEKENGERRKAEVTLARGVVLGLGSLEAGGWWMVGSCWWMVGASEASSVGLKSTNRVVGPSISPPPSEDPKNRTPSIGAVVGPDGGTFPWQQKITDIGIQLRRQKQAKKVKKCAFVGHHGNQKFFRCTFGE